MSLTPEQFHDDLEATSARLARRQTITSVAGVLVIAVLLAWALVTTTSLARSLQLARATQLENSARLLLVTRVLCQDAALSGQAPAECSAYSGTVTEGGDNHGSGAGGTVLP